MLISFFLLSLLLANLGCSSSENKEDNSKTPENTASSKCSLPVFTDGVSRHGQLSVKDGILTDESGESFQLRGMSTHGIGWYPNYVNAGAMKTIREYGANAIRIAIYTEGDNCYLSEPERNMNIVIQAIENARAMDMYIVVDWHILSDGDPNKYTDKAISFFDAVASRYQNDPSVIYEICNEPNGVEWSAITKYAYAICHVIRQYSQQAVIILGTPDYSFQIETPLEEPFSAENILYSYHYYAGLHNDYSVFRRTVEKGLPIIVSEWGISKNTSGEPELDGGKEFVSYLNKKGISWCAWSMCNKDEVYSVLKPDCDKLSGWQENDLTDVGKTIFSAMGGTAK